MSIVVLGGGLSGLSAAYYLVRKFPKQPVTLVEASSRLGGWIKTDRVDEVLFEQGPRTIRPQGVPGQNTLSLVEELGLDNEVLPMSTNHPAARNRMIYVNGEMHKLPSSFSSLFFKQKPFSKSLFRYLIHDLYTPKREVKDESIYDFTSRRFGPEFADYLISAMVCGICAGNAKEISVNFLLKNFFEYEQKYGSVLKGIANNVLSGGTKQSQQLGSLAMRAKNERWNIFSFKNGLETLPKALEANLRNSQVNIELNAICKSVEMPTDQDNALVYLEDGKVLNGQNVISSLPSENLAPLLEKHHPELSELLNKIKSVTVGVVNLHYDKKLIHEDGFGFLVPPKENLPILGVIYDSCSFPRDNGTVLTVMMGGSWYDQLFGKNADEATLLKTAKEQLKQIIGIVQEPLHTKVRILRNCIPQYTVGHTETVEKINEYISKNKMPLTICGASYYGVGINDVILSAKNAVDKLF